MKCLLRQEMVVGGWQDLEKHGRSLRALPLGYCDRNGRLVFAGKAVTGFSLQRDRQLVDRLRKIERPDPPFAEIPREYLGCARRAQVGFTSGRSAAAGARALPRAPGR